MISYDCTFCNETWTRCDIRLTLKWQIPKLGVLVQYGVIQCFSQSPPGVGTDCLDSGDYFVEVGIHMYCAQYGICLRKASIPDLVAQEAGLPVEVRDSSHCRLQMAPESTLYPRSCINVPLYCGRSLRL